MKKLLCLAFIVMAMVNLVSSGVASDATRPLVVDVRTEAEWQAGHLEGAVLIPYDQIEAKIGEMAKDKSKKIYLYCRSGRRAEIAKEALEKLGYRDVVNLGSLEEAAGVLKLRIVK